MGELTVIGYSGAELGAEALAELASATLVVGGARHLAAVPVPEGARTIRVGALEPALDAIARHRRAHRASSRRGTRASSASCDGCGPAGSRSRG